MDAAPSVVVTLSTGVRWRTLPCTCPGAGERPGGTWPHGPRRTPQRHGWRRPKTDPSCRGRTRETVLSLLGGRRCARCRVLVIGLRLSVAWRGVVCGSVCQCVAHYIYVGGCCQGAADEETMKHGWSGSRKRVGVCVHTVRCGALGSRCVQLLGYTIHANAEMVVVCA